MHGRRWPSSLPPALYNVRMCLIAVAWQSHPRFPLVIAANRDEFHARPAEPVHLWQTPPGLVAGRDLEAGGTWLGAAAPGRFAAITNVRRPGPLAEGVRSRGELPVEFLRSRASPTRFAAALAARGGEYRGYNLLLATADAMVLTSNCGVAPTALTPGIHAVSNAPPGVDWPKTRRARATLGTALQGDHPPDRLIEAAFALLADAAPAADDELPDTGLSQVQERQLSAIFIAGPDYGTRCSTVALLDDQGCLSLRERRFGPHGELAGETQLTLRFGS
jgi:uncharacterized protein with NRDE domain